MAITDDLRKTLTDPTPLYFAAGAADLALQQARKVPGLIEQVRAEAPARLEAVRAADPKAVQERVTVQARETQVTVQAKVNEIFGALDGDFKKLGEQAQDFALRGVGVAAEYAVRARETYEKVAVHGEETVKSWRGDAAEEINELAVAVEPDAEPVPTATASKVATEPEPVVAEVVEPEPTVGEVLAEAEASGAKKPAAKKSAAKRAAKKPTPPTEA
ncbi:hypothetical protein [Streptomyces sp. NPDC060194]|uniref:hypothetical protein n=1 Tax=Streptomyces sp. NPDC060194 TaxID=3347069 RepID=UPI00365AD191